MPDMLARQHVALSAAPLSKAAAWFEAVTELPLPTIYPCFVSVSVSFFNA